MSKKKQNKLRNRKITVDDIVFDSKMEAQFYVYLKNKKEKKEIKDFDIQPSYKLLDAYIIVNGETIPETDERYKKLKNSKDKELDFSDTIYTADFKIYYNDGREEVIDVKGFETDAFILRRKMFNLKYPNTKLSLVRKFKDGWKDLDQHKKERARKRTAATYKKKRKSKEEINKNIEKVLSKKQTKEECLEKIKKIKNLTQREKDKTIEIFLRENKLDKDFL